MLGDGHFEIVLQNGQLDAANKKGIKFASRTDVEAAYNKPMGLEYLF